MSRRLFNNLLFALALFFIATKTKADVEEHIGLASLKIDEWNDETIFTKLRELERDNRWLQDDTSEGDGLGKLGEVCGNHNPCVDGLDCTSTGWWMRRHCTPSQQCLKEGLTNFTSKYDMEALKEEVFASAGISEFSFLELYKDSGRHTTFQSSDEYQSVKQSMRNILKEPTQDFLRIQMECSMLERSIDKNSTTENVYLGIHIEGGVILDGSFSYFFGVENLPYTDTSGDLIRFCGGVEPLAGAEVSFIIGGTPNYSGNNFYAGLTFFLDFDLALGPAVGFAVGFGNEGVMLEGTFGAGAGIGAGVSLCAAWAP